MSRAAWKAFEAQYPDTIEDVCERIGEAIIGHYQGYTVDGVHVSDVYQHDVCNHTISGSIDVEIGGEVCNFGFIARSGNWAGFEMEEWGDDVGTYEPPAPDPLIPIPPIGAHRGDWARWDRQRKEAWFQRLVSDRSYDAHFAPGLKTNSHYRDEVQRRGLRWVHESEIKAIRAAAPPAPKKARRLTRAEKAEIFMRAMGMAKEIMR